MEPTAITGHKRGRGQLTCSTIHSLLAASTIDSDSRFPGYPGAKPRGFASLETLDVVARALGRRIRCSGAAPTLAPP